MAIPIASENLSRESLQEGGRKGAVDAYGGEQWQISKREYKTKGSLLLVKSSLNITETWVAFSKKGGGKGIGRSVMIPTAVLASDGGTDAIRKGG